MFLTPNLEWKIANLPESPGCYLMKSDGRIIYVGKAKNLKNRVRQYFQSSRNHTPKVLAMVEKSGLQPVMILVTHGHYDHVRGIPGLLEKYPDLPIYIHEKELCEAEAWSKRFWLPHQGANQRTYAEGDTLALGTLTVKVMETPGHSAGSVVLLVEDFMLSGDTLFAGACVRLDLPCSYP